MTRDLARGLLPAVSEANSDETALEHWAEVREFFTSTAALSVPIPSLFTK